MDNSVIKEILDNLSAEVKEVKETQKEHLIVSQGTQIQATKTNGRVNNHDEILKDIKNILEKHDKKISTIWDWRMLFLGGGFIIMGLLSYLIPASINFARSVNELKNNIQLSEERIKRIVDDALKDYQAELVK